MAAEVSIIIPCFNQAHYLKDAIESVLVQQYPSIEVIVVNDGSADRTEEVAKSFPAVKYIYQPNGGLSSARNKGIENASGEFLIFLDADDILLPGSLKLQVEKIKSFSEAAFVSGGYIVSDAKLKPLWECRNKIDKDHYTGFLLRNYIGMHATVIYRRSVFDQYRFNTALKACEDYDLYLKVAAKYPVCHHSEMVAVYRRHNLNMSGNLPMMLKCALSVLEKNYREVGNKNLESTYLKGRRNWINYYCREMYYQLTSNTSLEKKYKGALLQTLIKNKPDMYFRYRLKKLLKTSNANRQITN